MADQDFLNMLQGALDKVIQEDTLAQKIEKYKERVNYAGLLDAVRRQENNLEEVKAHLEKLAEAIRLLGCTQEDGEICHLAFLMGENFRAYHQLFHGKTFGTWHGDIDDPRQVYAIVVLGSKSMIQLDIIKSQYDETCLFFGVKGRTDPAPITGYNSAALLGLSYLKNKMFQMEEELEKARKLVSDTDKQIERIKNG